MNILLVLALALTLLNAVSTHEYHKTWSVKVKKGVDVDQLARECRMVNLGQIGQIEDHYLFERASHPRRSRRHAVDITEEVESHHMVLQAEQQRIVSRQKRSLQARQITFSDPNYPKQWYLKHSYNNVTNAWTQGVTGRGVVVTILDDGLEYTHPDLQKNYEPKASADLNDNDDDPMPRYDITNENKHGTRCAGEVSSVANNNICGVGAAYNAKIGGVRMLDGDVTDAVEARAIGLNPQFIDIYSASWGPDDDGQTVDGPGKLTKASFTLGIDKGRNGLGSIFVWASGNGGMAHDNCNCDGYTNSIWTLSIGSASELGEKPWYAEECSSTMAVTYSSGSSKEQQIYSTDLHSKCTEHHTGTSAAAPLAAGIFALVLQANPTLTWRDMQYLVISTSKESNLKNPEWVTNGVGRKVSHKFGFGVIDAGALVTLAGLWNNIPEQRICKTEEKEPKKDIASGKEVEFVIKTDGCRGETQVIHLEHVQAVITMQARKRGDISLALVSPMGTRSQLLTSRKYDSSSSGFTAWPFLTVHKWGENPEGKWTLIVRNNGQNTMELVSWSLNLHGTRTLPKLRNTTGNFSALDEQTSGSCHKECDASFGCTGKGSSDCNQCLHYVQQGTGNCVGICGPDEHLNRKGTVCVKHCDVGEYVTESGQCDPCSPHCATCDGPGRDNCTGCNEGLFLDPSLSVCTEECPPNMLTKGSTCVQCHSNCLTCSEVEYDKCLTCQPTLLLHQHQCLQYCPKGMYANQTLGGCLQCSAGCETCYGDQSYQCLKCDRGLFLAGSSCVEQCPASYYQVTDTQEEGGGQCRRCHWTCEQCDSSTSHDCSLCITGLYKEKTQCIQQCSDGAWQSPTLRTCEQCHPACVTCLGPNQDQCTSCREGYRISRSHCVPTCPEGQYNDQDTCKVCDATCQNCNGPSATNCTSCSTTRHLLGAECVTECPKGFYQYYDSGQQLCRACTNVGCAACADNDKCTACSPGYQLQGEQCINTCHTGEFLKEGVCAVCSGECSTCIGPENTQCLSCKEPSLNRIITQYQINSTMYCGECSNGCELCSRPYNNYCLSCHAPLALHRDDSVVAGRASCVTACPKGTFLTTSRGGLAECVACHDTCSDCSAEGMRSCSSCPEGLVLEAGMCISACTSSFYKTGSVCEPCSNLCASCSGPQADKCLSCPPGQLHKGQTCVEECPESFYVNEEEQTCEQCFPTCNQCTGPGSHQCTKCIAGFTMSGGRCTSTCSAGLYNDKDLNYCKPCHVSCLNCTDGGTSSCLSCKAPLAKNPSTNECWPCCRAGGSEYCCYCEHSPLTCTQHVDNTMREEMGTSPFKIAAVLAVMIAITAFFGGLGLLLRRWCKVGRPVNYTLLSSRDQEPDCDNLISSYNDESGMVSIQT